ncbi:hypothetical protein M011DRAFT_488911 [Sporormia fimetaria CBS 119925]|uniref:Uncharacterized protein n=1 Tax=Sporormia fimetaria CBS 119925 TaxID=1340428 RepID=A0A6A6V451_9PLEO|nr:hypothetical protein M011DRAFT_488911 [Sporormia fimetaria CBS 119925]
MGKAPVTLTDHLHACSTKAGLIEQSILSFISARDTVDDKWNNLLREIQFFRDVDKELAKRIGEWEREQQTGEVNTSAPASDNNSSASSIAWTWSDLFPPAHGSAIELDEEERLKETYLESVVKYSHTLHIFGYKHKSMYWHDTDLNEGRSTSPGFKFNFEQNPPPNTNTTTITDARPTNPNSKSKPRRRYHNRNAVKPFMANINTASHNRNISESLQNSKGFSARAQRDNARQSESNTPGEKTIFVLSKGSQVSNLTSIGRLLQDKASTLQEEASKKQALTNIEKSLYILKRMGKGGNDGSGFVTGEEEDSEGAKQEEDKPDTLAYYKL